jgi:hypothetical protein
VASALARAQGDPSVICPACVNADTPERLNELVLAAPGFSVCDLEVHPLVDFVTMEEQLVDALKKAATLLGVGGGQ